MNTDLHLLTGAYAVDALDAAERAAFEAHLAGCEACAEEVAGLRATGAVLGLAAAVTPDERFGRDLMAQVRATRQQPPIEAPGEDGGRVLPLLRRARTTSRALLAVAAALLVVSGGLGAVAVREQHRADVAQSAAAEVASVLAAPDARTVTGQGQQGASARAIVSASRASAVLVGQSLPDVGADHALQLWVLGDGQPRSVGLIDPGRPIVAHGVKPGLRLGVTVEPAGGSPQPTTAPIMQVDLA